jgi:hypothetical protein
MVMYQDSIAILRLSRVLAHDTPSPPIHCWLARCPAPEKYICDPGDKHPNLKCALSQSQFYHDGYDVPLMPFAEHVADLASSQVVLQ